MQKKFLKLKWIKFKDVGFNNVLITLNAYEISEVVKSGDTIEIVNIDGIVFLAQKFEKIGFARVLNHNL